MNPHTVTPRPKRTLADRFKALAPAAIGALTALIVVGMLVASILAALAMLKERRERPAPARIIICVDSEAGFRCSELEAP